MTERPRLVVNIDPNIFREHQYQKEELISFCVKNGLQTHGTETELVERIFIFLTTGVRMVKEHGKKKMLTIPEITSEMMIEEDVIFTERMRRFYHEHLGRSFWFHPEFQSWMRSNPGRTYGDGIAAYRMLEEERNIKRNARVEELDHIAYVKEFLADNPDMTEKDAERCWEHRRRIPGSKLYERNDLSAL